MPGLPRASTARQFKKLMKKSGKAKTNKAAGATDPSSRKIATYEQFVLMREQAGNEDVDPYGEEFKESVGWEEEPEDEDFEYGSPFPKDIHLLEVGQVYTTDKGDPYTNSFKIIKIEPIRDFHRVTFETSTGSKFIMPFEKALTYDFVRVQ